ncbi:hypothetical protein GIB67_019717 [Kingdonia uniflora]|uniref:Reverse transcriptase zinc-binding domain-containing protein n=1 Tax=Kingdonia uniflora TaxID=39325 RepID=A0A7J7MJY6_9MAGN|nr:hypothetical protein GIB67_019717 [Kingdonia uniflora]
MEAIRSTKPKVWWANLLKCNALHPKSRIFLWRVCQNVLATEDNFRRRGLSFPSRCSLCLVETESVNHRYGNVMQWFPFGAGFWISSCCIAVPSL